jgi:hypothetical protein
LQEILPISETLFLEDTVTITTGTAPYTWGPNSPQPTWNFFTWQ